jgi:hypothetical protein
MKDGEEDDRMPPNSTQNLNAKLSGTAIGQRRSGGPAPSFAPRVVQSPAQDVKVISGPRQYRGGYHLNV